MNLGAVPRARGLLAGRESAPVGSCPAATCSGSPSPCAPQEMRSRERDEPDHASAEPEEDEQRRPYGSVVGVVRWTGRQRGVRVDDAVVVARRRRGHGVRQERYDQNSEDGCPDQQRSEPGIPKEAAHRPALSACAPKNTSEALTSFSRASRLLHAPMRKSLPTERYASGSSAERRNPALVAGG